ncbi:DUF3883 domain-containing protein [Maribacter sp.]|uniref:sacsin N-terminal ATP-binding-like domain-containing protein n=1 Tax=Maribacter sp. TaxID=1897614 RepID=UPI00329A5612
MAFKEDIENLIEEKTKFYKDNKDHIIRDYNDEKELAKEYESRQLLELLQNVDDTGSTKAQIIWDKDKNTIAIANMGEAFSASGIKSIMLGHFSTKIKSHFIGNKGLGFRSVLNWAEAINIYSNGSKVTFSEKNAKTIFEEELKLTKEQKKELRLAKGLKDSAIPFPFLAIPTIEDDNSNNDWKTIVEIKYRTTAENSIKKQVNELCSELLLFLNNIEILVIRISGEAEQTYKSKRKEKEDYWEITINETSWKVFTKEKKLPDNLQDKEKSDPQKYQIKVAYQENLSDRYYKLFNYFPTKVSVSLPCIVHCTFELNSSRDYLNPSDVNIFILKKLTKLLKKCAIHLTKKRVDWRPFKLLTPIDKSTDSELVADFYTKIEELKKETKVYPSISDNYIPLNKAIFYNNDFNLFFKDNFKETLPDLILPLEDGIVNEFKNDTYTKEYLVEQIDKLSYKDITIEQRAHLIIILNEVHKSDTTDDLFSLLINQKKKEVIPKTTTTFTPVKRAKEEFEIPDEIKVDFINTDLYDAILIKIKDGFDKKEPESREFQRAIKNVVNIQPYDSNNVIDKVITGTRQEIASTKTENDKRVLVKEMVKALYINFPNIDNKLEVLKTEVPLLNKNNEVTSANDLFLSETYPSGAITNIIFEDLYTNEDYILPINEWGIEVEREQEIETFFLWLGVYKYIKIGKKSLANNWAENEYIETVFSKDVIRPDNFDIGKISRESVVSFIDDFNLIKEIEVNKLLLLVLKDSFLRKQLENNEEHLYWSYVKVKPAISTSISYIKFQFLKYKIFTSYIIQDTNDTLKSIVNQGIFIDYSWLKQYGYESSTVNSILIRLGAKETIETLHPKLLYKVLLDLPSQFDEAKPKGVQNLYKLVVEALEEQDLKQDLIIEIPENLALYAKKNGETVLLPASEVYYANNSVLPKKIEKSIPILNYPKRGGQDKLEKYLGIKIINPSHLVLNDDYKVSKEIDSEFQKLLEQLKPSLLAYRLFSKSLKKEISTKEAIQQNVNYLKNTSIKLVESATYTYNEENHIALENYDFIIFKNTFFIKIPQYESLKVLLKESDFSDAFAEIMSIQFKVTDLKNDFRFLIRNDIKDTMHLIKKDFDEENLSIVHSFFGVSVIEVNFWKSIFKLKKIAIKDEFNKQEELINYIEEKLEIEIPNTYNQFNFEVCDNEHTYNFIQYLTDNLGSNIEQIYSQGIEKWHIENLRNVREDYEGLVKQQLWYWLNENKEGQIHFLSYIEKFTLEPLERLYKYQDKFKLVIDYKKVLSDFINKNLPITLQSENKEEVTIENKYKELLSRYSYDINDMNNEIKSLLYFVNNHITIESYLKDNTKDKEIKEEEKIIDDEAPLDLIEATFEKSNNQPKRLKKKKRKKTRKTHSKKGDETKSLSGKEAERKVLKALQKKYGNKNVKWVSGFSDVSNNNDDLQYDITYKNENNVWKHVEVKALSKDNSFILTKAEKEHGIDESELYEFALVSSKKIYRIYSPFNFSSTDNFETNDSFIAQPKDYTLHFIIKEK